MINIVAQTPKLRIKYVYKDGLSYHVGEMICNGREAVLSFCRRIKDEHPDAIFAQY